MSFGFHFICGGLTTTNAKIAKKAKNLDLKVNLIRWMLCGAILDSFQF